jgi:hypothetical protein
MNQFLLFAIIILQSCTVSLKELEIKDNTGPITESDTTTQQPKNEAEVIPQLPAHLDKFFPPFMV